MSDQFSVSFGPAIATWLARAAPDGMREKVINLREAYERGESSAKIDLSAYLTVRAPATFASISAALTEVALLTPDFAPESMMDVGAGPGTASFAAAAAFPSLQSCTLLEADPRFAKLAAELAQGLPFPSTVRQQSLLSAIEPASLIVAGYVLAELTLPQMAQIALHLWRATRGVLVLVEPGTPQGFARIKVARETLVKSGANIVGPCTHEAACPMAGDDWCHFKARLQRSRAHMHAKGGTVPFEDEAYSWLAVSRFAVPRPQARIIAAPTISKIGVNLPLCGKAGLHQEMIASRDKPAYKRAKKLEWGDGFSRAGVIEA